ncbi:MAG: hypothetical protein P8Z79_12905 [Sedimentisphaerales bacterium]|jgi:hypothetical protein
MVFGLNLLWWGYLALWAVLLIHCLVKKRFFPVLGRGWGTKVFWLVTFIFRNPLLTLLYVIFGVFSKADEANVHKIHVRGAICLALVLVVVGVFELPKPDRQKNEATVLYAGQDKDKEKGLNFHAQAGVLESNNSLSTGTSSTTSGNAKLVAGSIIIRNESHHVLIDKACRFMQAKLVELPYVEKVEYWPSGVEMSDPLNRADIVIAVDAHKITEGGFGINRKLQAEISCYAGTEPVETFHHTHYHNSPPRINFSMNNNLTHNSLFKGFESSKAKYEQQSKDIGQQLVGAITKQFEKWIEKYGLMPELPEYMYGREGNEVEFDFLKDRNALLLHHSGGLLNNFYTVWSYEDERPNVEAFRDVCEILREQGWAGGYGGKESGKRNEHKIESFTMSKGDDHIQIFRMRGRKDSGGIINGDDESLEKKLPIIVEYQSLFTNEQIDDVLGKLFASEADLDTKLIFENYSFDKGVKQLLLDSVRSQSIKTMDGYLMVGRYYAHEDETAKATEALMMARALGRAEQDHGPSSNEIRKLAKKIGDESLAKVAIGIEHYKRAGFIDLSTVQDGAVYERAVDEPLMFYSVADDGNNIKTITIRISKVAGKEDQYETQIIKKQPGSTSVSNSGLAERVFLLRGDEGQRSLRLDIDKLENERFKLTVQGE